MKRALEVDPLSPIINADLAVAYEAVDQYDEAIEQFHRTIELEPGFYKAHLWLGNALAVHGDLVTAIAEYQKAEKLSDDPGIPQGSRGLTPPWVTRRTRRKYSISCRSAQNISTFPLPYSPCFISRWVTRMRRCVGWRKVSGRRRHRPSGDQTRPAHGSAPRGSTLRKARQSNPAVKRASGGNGIDSGQIDCGSAL